MYEEEGMWYVANSKLDAVFGLRDGSLNIRKGPYGLKLVVNWLSKARKHEMWDSDEDKARRLVKPPGWDSASDNLVKIKMENILLHVKELECQPPNLPDSGGPAGPAVPLPDGSKGKKHDEDPKEADLSPALISKKPPVEVKSSTKREYIASVADLLKLCPLSTPIKPCDRCNVEELIRRKEFQCHCGAQKKILHGGRTEAAQEHWKTARCVKKTADIRSSQVLTSFFSSTPVDPVAVPRLKRGYIEVACPGLKDETWDRPRATKTIEQFLENTCSIYRGSVRHKVVKELFGENTTESSLSKVKKAKLLDTLDARAIWLVKRHGSRNAIYSPKCLKTLVRRTTDPNTACSKCCTLKDLSSLTSAVNHDYAGTETLKYTNNTLMLLDAYNAKLVQFSDLRTCKKSLELSQGGDFSAYLSHVAILAKNGLFKNRDAVKGLIMGVTVRAEREDAGKSLRGMRVDPYLDDCLTTLGAMNRSALNLFTKTFAGRTARSQRQIQARDGGKMESGIHLSNFKRIAANLAALGYSGPIAAASDQTVCVKTLRHHNGSLVGAQGPDVPFEDAKELRDLVEKILRAYTIQVPLPNVPTYVVALLSSRTNEGATDIASEHEEVITLAHEVGINILSMGADGAATELSAQEKLVEKSTQFHTYTNATLNVYIKIPLFGEPPRPIICIQDPKHARKTGANQLLSGAHLLVIGNYTVTIQQLAEILKMPNSPLHAKDVFDSDKQDDGRALRTFCAPTLAAAITLENNTGLTIYLYVVGELVDSWLNKKIRHHERIRSAWTAGFFMRRWKAYLQKREKETNGLMSFHQNCISHAGFKIFSTLPKSLLALIIAHRDYYSGFPLFPWKHGTEPCEHIFGWMRVISPRFSVLDARFMMPKIHAVVKSAMSGRIKIPPSEHLHSGYQYAFGDEEDAENFRLLQTWPTNSEIAHELTIANQIANSLAELAGMGPVDPDDEELEVDRVLEELELPIEDETPDVSVCSTKDYCVKYSAESGDWPEELAFSEAALLAKDQNALDLLLNQVPDEVDSDAIKNAAISIASLLNPSVYGQPRSLGVG
ncbi:uncharacterized protein MELLADRAFT_96134 [Melampsora larici-populina 98AG31]|uniref:Uncharacterized protein n=1 Tax=Melampsora larici-populina (strain 98AG31 / pathotype 3-4-7) TaxID=747676 RepID=F4SB35_MELLP|nr:uncharacterized protein MELLADRAFT_96134 [Melampsora larici-populina 98AG31]EGF98144.1 hypothetical protein MELLADRAFT_96134 [Melampsora larici-populina 98AG31]